MSSCSSASVGTYGRDELPLIRVGWNNLVVSTPDERELVPTGCSSEHTP
jgi:hypothetical protein